MGRTVSQRSASQQSIAARARWKRWFDDLLAAEKGDPEAIARVAAWNEAVAKRQPTTPGMSRGEDGRYRLEQIPGRSWRTRQGAHQALQGHVSRGGRPAKMGRPRKSP